MIVCEHCESARFLNIVRSRTYAGNGSSVSEIVETIECQTCGLEGKAEFDLESDTVTLEGALVRTDDEPTTATTVELRGGTQ